MKSRIVGRTALATACAALLLASCGGPAGHGTSGTGTTSLPPTAGEECPHDWPWTGAIQSNVEEFTGNRYETPEYNDCQRFIVGSPSAPSYSASVFAVFASDSLAEKKWSGNAQVVALVWADDVYPPLGIEAKGFHCLLMTPTGQKQWKAKMMPAGPDADCARRDTAKAVELKVDRWPTIPGTQDSIRADALPGVVRWSFAPGPAGRVTWVQYVVLPCAKDLCYVGPVGFQARPTFAILASMNLDNKGSRRGVDVWNDVQYLAAPSPSPGGGGPKPDSPLLEGVIVPDSALADRKLADYEKGWVQIAEVAVSGAGYLSKMNFAATTGPVKKYNLIFACYYEEDGSGGFGNCAETQKDTTGLAALTCPASSTDPGRWRTKHVNAADPAKVTYYCVDFIPFADPALAVPGTVRWKWLANDEMTWFRCPDGCCKELE